MRCSALNPPEQIYCLKCGKFLSGQNQALKASPTVWDLGQSRQAKNHIQTMKAVPSEEYVVVCPQCNLEESVTNGIMPLACGQCGYFFQAGIDKIISKNDAKKQQSNPMEPVPVQAPSTASSSKQKGPLARRDNDTTSLRLIMLSQQNIMPQRVKEAGEILGKDGTILKQVKTSQQLSIWHSPAGWYMRALNGHPLYNGVPLNENQQMKLSDGDMLTIEREQIRVEIV